MKLKNLLFAKNVSFILLSIIFSNSLLASGFAPNMDPWLKIQPPKQILRHIKKLDTCFTSELLSAQEACFEPMKDVVIDSLNAIFNATLIYLTSLDPHKKEKHRASLARPYSYIDGLLRGELVLDEDEVIKADDFPVADGADRNFYFTCLNEFLKCDLNDSKLLLDHIYKEEKFFLEKCFFEVVYFGLRISAPTEERLYTKFKGELDVVKEDVFIWVKCLKIIAPHLFKDTVNHTQSINDFLKYYNQKQIKDLLTLSVSSRDSNHLLEFWSKRLGVIDKKNAELEISLKKAKETLADLAKLETSFKTVNSEINSAQKVFDSKFVEEKEARSAFEKTLNDKFAAELQKFSDQIQALSESFNAATVAREAVLGSPEALQKQFFGKLAELTTNIDKQKTDLEDLINQQKTELTNFINEQKEQLENLKASKESIERSESPKEHMDAQTLKSTSKGQLLINFLCGALVVDRLVKFVREQWSNYKSTKQPKTNSKKRAQQDDEIKI